MWMLPAVGAMKPAIIRSVVVLPQPLGPRKVTSSPSAMSSEKSATAVVEPKRFCSLWSETEAMFTPPD